MPLPKLYERTRPKMVTLIHEKSKRTKKTRNISFFENNEIPKTKQQFVIYTTNYDRIRLQRSCYGSFLSIEQTGRQELGPRTKPELRTHYPSMQWPHDTATQRQNKPTMNIKHLLKIWKSFLNVLARIVGDILMNERPLRRSINTLKKWNAVPEKGKTRPMHFGEKSPLSRTNDSNENFSQI